MSRLAQIIVFLKYEIKRFVRELVLDHYALMCIQIGDKEHDLENKTENIYNEWLKTNLNELINWADDIHSDIKDNPTCDFDEYIDWVGIKKELDHLIHDSASPEKIN